MPAMSVHSTIPHRIEPPTCLGMYVTAVEYRSMKAESFMSTGVLGPVPVSCVCVTVCAMYVVFIVEAGVHACAQHMSVGSQVHLRVYKYVSCACDCVCMLYLLCSKHQRVCAGACWCCVPKMIADILHTLPLGQACMSA